MVYPTQTYVTYDKLKVLSNGANVGAAKARQIDFGAGMSVSEDTNNNKYIISSTGTTGSSIVHYDYFIYKNGSSYVAVSGDNLPAYTTSSTDFKTVLQAVIGHISPVGTPTLIVIGAGNNDVAAQALVSTSAIGNINIVGLGSGITNLVITSAWNGVALGTPAIKIGDTLNSVPSSITGTLTANCPLTSMTLTVSPADSLKFAVGDLILLTSTLAWSTAPSASSPQTETKKITAINNSTGVITFDVPTFDAYATANTAVIYKLGNFLKNIKVSDLSIVKGAGLNTDLTNATGVVFFRAACVENLQIENVQLIDNVTNYDSGINVVSCINSNIHNCHIYQNPSQAYNLQYGISIESCCQNVVVSDCRSFGRWRHPFEMCNDQVGTGLQGICRNITASNCTSEGSEVASFDCHPGGEILSFNNCRVLGTTDSTGSVGFEVRTRKTQLVGCGVEGANTYGIQFSGDSHDGLVIGCVSRGCVSEGFRAVNDAGGVKRLKLIGNIFSNCGNNGIRFDSGCDSATIQGNTCNNNLNNGMYLEDSDHLDINHNTVQNNTNNGIWINSPTLTLNDIYVTENQVNGNSTQINIGSNVKGNSRFERNPGYNPVGTITNAWPNATGDLRNASATNAAPVSTAVYTCRLTPKKIIITGGTITTCTINGTATTIKEAEHYMEVGETIAFTYSVAPTAVVRVL